MNRTIMNAIELYKKLPKTNCGRCAQKACMPFALSVIKGDADLSSCPMLEAAQADELRNSIRPADWREELILSLRQKIKDVDLQDVSFDLGGEYRDSALYISCLGRDFIISPDGEISSEGHITPWMKILLLHYINTHGRADLAGRWVSYGELKSGMVKATSFQREGEDPIRDLFDRDFVKAGDVLEALGAKKSEEFPTPHAWIINLLPKVPAAILYWPEEDEFPSKVKILFDRTADRFLDVESLIFLIEGFVKNMEYGLSSGKGS